MAKFNSTADLTTSKIATLTKNASCFAESDPGFKEVKLTDPMPAFSGTFREKKNVLDNFDVFIFVYMLTSQYNNLKENYQKIPNFMNENKKIIDSEEDRSYGTVGIYNIGNTCFLNTGKLQKTYKLYKLIKAIQLLSNTQPLADYFIADLHLREINEQNQLGSKGLVTQAFAELIKFFYFLYFY